MNKTNPGATILRLKDYTNITGKTNEILSRLPDRPESVEVCRLSSGFKVYVLNIYICLDRDPDWK